MVKRCTSLLYNYFVFKNIYFSSQIGLCPVKYKQYFKFLDITELIKLDYI